MHWAQGRLLPQCSAVYYFPAAEILHVKNSRMYLDRGYLKNCFGNWGDKNLTKAVSADLVCRLKPSHSWHRAHSPLTRRSTHCKFPPICQNLHLPKKSGLTKSERATETSSWTQQTTLCFWIKRNNLKNKKKIFFSMIITWKLICVYKYRNWKFEIP